MKYLCPGCERLVELAGFRVEGGALVVTCARCGVEARTEGGSALDSARAEPVEGAADPFLVPAGHCPKCVARRSPSSPSCPWCGLIYDNFVADRADLSEWLQGEWRALLLAFGDAARHDAFLAGAAAREELPAAGRLYRIQLALRPEDPMALRGRDEVLRLASLPSFISAGSTEAPRRTPAWKYGVAAVFAMACLGAIYLMLSQVTGASP